MNMSLLALLIATVFASAALYITIVEHPARLRLNDSAMLAQWQPSYSRALPIQGALAALGGIAGLLAWLGTREWQFLAGSIAMLANWPFTLIAIMPINRRLLAIKPEEAGAESASMLRQWGRFHALRSALGLIAVALFLLGLTNKGL